MIHEYSAAAGELIASFLEPLSDESLSEALVSLGRINASAQALGLQPKRAIPGREARRRSPATTGLRSGAKGQA